MNKKSKYFHNKHSKYSLHAHLIFCVKYRKRLLIIYGDQIKDLFLDISNKSDFNITTMEVDKDHIHLMIQFPPKISITSIVRRLKQISTYKLWLSHKVKLKKHFWVEHTFWSDGYFVCTTGDSSTESTKRYIESQG
jgi:putative transposase